MLNKTLLTFCLILIIYTTAFSQEHQKEVLLIGTMHEVPKIIKNAYRPLYKQALKYKPEAIYVETAMPNDSISWEYLKDGYSKSHQRFYVIADSLKRHYNFSETRLNKLLDKDFSGLTKDELQTIRLSFGYQRDWPNFQFYTYIAKYGVKGSKKPLRIENHDITAKLALALNHKKVYATDDQQTNKEFHIYWHKCETTTRENGDYIKLRKIEKKFERTMIIPSLFGRNGYYTNSTKTLNRLHTMSSLRYAMQKSNDCDLATQYFDERNQRIVKNLGTQILEKPNKKSVLIIGASHIIGVKEELEKQFPTIKVILFDEFRGKR